MPLHNPPNSLGQFLSRYYIILIWAIGDASTSHEHQMQCIYTTPRYFGLTFLDFFIDQPTALGLSLVFIYTRIIHFLVTEI